MGRMVLSRAVLGRVRWTRDTTIERGDAIGRYVHDRVGSRDTLA